jgi:hypothetical protein
MKMSPGMPATCSSTTVLVTPDATTYSITLAESDATCTTVTNGTDGMVRVPLGTRLGLDNDSDSYALCGTDDTCGLWAGGVEIIEWTSGIVDLNRPTRMQARGFVPTAVAADPCAATSNYPEGSIFYNSTADILCICNGSAADVKVSDGTACF